MRYRSSVFQLIAFGERSPTERVGSGAMDVLVGMERRRGQINIGQTVAIVHRRSAEPTVDRRRLSLVRHRRPRHAGGAGVTRIFIVRLGDSFDALDRLQSVVFDGTATLGLCAVRLNSLSVETGRVEGFVSFDSMSLVFTLTATVDWNGELSLTNDSCMCLLR